MYNSTNLAMTWEIRDSAGKVCKSGVTGGKRSWLLHEKYSKDNILLRAKTASGLSKSAKTVVHDGEGDVCRKLENGHTLHVFLREDIDPDLVADVNALEKLLGDISHTKARDVISALIVEMELSVLTASDDFLR